MDINLKGRNFLSLMNFTQDEIFYLLELAKDLKFKKRAGIKTELLKGKNIALLFEKPSTRTRCAFEVAIYDEGGHITYLDSKNSHFGEKESIQDSAKVLGRFYDAIEYRGFNQSTINELAKYSGVPVYNGLTNTDHPTQVLADLLTIIEYVQKPLNEVTLVFVGDVGNNMANAWMHGCAKIGMKYIGYGPQELYPATTKMEEIYSCASISGAKIELSDNKNCLLNADIIYTDVWVSMGEEKLMSEKVNLLKEYRVTMEMLGQTKNSNIKFMHCLPSFHNFETEVANNALSKNGLDIREVDDEVFNSSYSIVFDEAENRIHTIKAILVATI